LANCGTIWAKKRGFPFFCSPLADPGSELGNTW